MPFSIGQLAVGISGDSRVADIVRVWLEHLKGVGGQRQARVVFDIEADRRGRALRATDEAQSGRHCWTAEISSASSETVVFAARGCLAHRAGVLPSALYRWAHPGHLTQSEHLAMTFMHEVFLGVTHAYGLALGQTYIPASAASDGNRVVVVLGGGGTGKSGSLLRLCLLDGWQYISDDMTVLSRSGQISPSPKPIEVARRNLAGDEALKRRLLGKRPILDRIAWLAHERFRGGRGLRRVGTAAQLLGQRVSGAPGPVTDVFVVHRSGVPRMRLGAITAGDASARGSALLAAEMSHSWPLLESQPRTASAPRVSSVTPEGVERRLMQEAFSRARCMQITIPAEAPESVAEDAIIRALRGSSPPRMGLW